MFGKSNQKCHDHIWNIVWRFIIIIVTWYRNFYFGNKWTACLLYLHIGNPCNTGNIALIVLQQNPTFSLGETEVDMQICKYIYSPLQVTTCLAYRFSYYGWLSLYLFSIGQFYMLTLNKVDFETSISWDLHVNIHHPEIYRKPEHAIFTNEIYIILCWYSQSWKYFTHLGLVSHICVMKNSSHFPSDAYMHCKSIYFSYRPWGRPTKQ